MADKDAKAQETETTEETTDEAAKKGGIMGLLTKMPVIIGGAMVVEGVVLVLAMQMLGGGADTADADTHDEVVLLDEHGEPIDNAHAEDDGHGDDTGHGEEAGGDGHGGDAGHATYTAGPNELVEVTLGNFRASNHMDGRRYIYDLELSLQVKGKSQSKVQGKIDRSTALIRDRISVIISRIDPQKLNGAAEPGLETLRRQVKYQMEQIVGEGYIEEVLVPRCIPYRTDY